MTEEQQKWIKEYVDKFAWTDKMVKDVDLLLKD